MTSSGFDAGLHKSAAHGGFSLLRTSNLRPADDSRLYNHRPAHTHLGTLLEPQPVDGMSAPEDTIETDDEARVTVVPQSFFPLVLSYEAFERLVAEAWNSPPERVLSLGFWPLSFFRKACIKYRYGLSYGVPVHVLRHVPAPILSKGVGLIELWREPDLTHEYLCNYLEYLIDQGLRR